MQRVAVSQDMRQTTWSRCGEILVLQRAAACCRVLQGVAAHCSLLQCVAVPHDMQKKKGIHCMLAIQTVVQCVAVYCSV